MGKVNQSISEEHYDRLREKVVDLLVRVVVVHEVPGLVERRGEVVRIQLANPVLDAHGLCILGFAGAGLFLDERLALFAAGDKRPEGAILPGGIFLGQVLPIVPLLIVQGSGYVLAGLAVAWLTRSRA